MTSLEFPDREQIEAALRRVQAGELSPAEATELLLAEGSPRVPPEQNHQPPRHVGEESLASLIDRLGTPPVDVVEAWCGQVTRAAVVHERDRGQALPSIDLRQWAINGAGELLWNGRSFPQLRVSEAQSARLKTESRAQIDRFRSSLLSDELLSEESHSDETAPDDQTSVRPQAAPDPVVTTDPAVPVDTPIEAESAVAPQVRTNDAPAASGHAAAKRPSRRLLIGGASLVCLAAVVAIPFTASDKNEVASNPTPAPPGPIDAVSEHATGDQPSGEPLESMSEGELETLDSPGDVNPEPLVPLDAMLSLDALLPATGFLTPTLMESETRPVDPTAADPLVESDETKRDADAAIDTSVTGAPDESPQQTRARTVTSVNLPDIGDSATVAELWDRSAQSLSLSFPIEVPLALSEGDPQAGWRILDTRHDVTVAQISAGEKGNRLAWSDGAAASSPASSLVHGRLADDRGSVIYLRPTIEADPWPIQLDEADVRPTWDLRSPIPPRVARMTVEFDLPEDIEEAWVEPIEPAALRRTRGLAILTPGDSETVALGMRFDVRCGRKLSVRVRYAARLSPTMPWQAVSNESLLRFADQLTERVSALSRQSTQLAALYERADTDQRRLLRPKRDRLESEVDWLQSASQRVADLQAMIDTIQEGGFLKWRVWVTWPDAEQTLLATASED